jgi:hypothetical protein
MNRKALILAAAAVALLLVGLRFAISGPSDRELIKEAVRESIEASKDGRPGGVLEYLSSGFEINDQAPGRFDISKFVRESRPDVEVLNLEPVITGNDATIRSSVRVRMKFMGQDFDQTFEDVTIVLRREPARRYLVIPSSQWRIVQVQAPTTNVADFSTGFDSR